MTNNQGKVRISKEAFLKTLHAVSSPDEERKASAKKKLEALEVKATDELGIHLIECIIDINSSPKVVESASAILEEYVETHWCSTAENFKPPEIGLECKAKIKTVLLYGLCMSNSKVRHAIADSVSFIAQSDWPDHWPELFDTLVEYLYSEKSIPTFGSLRVLTALTGQLTEVQLSNVGPVILHEMYRIFDDDENSLSMRERAIGIFTNIVVGVAYKEQPEQVHRLLEPSIAMFCAEFLERLRMENDELTETKLRLTIINAVREIVGESPKCISTVLPKMLTLIWKILSACAKIYQETTANVGEEVPENVCDLVLSIFYLIQDMINGTHECAYFRPRYNLPDYQWLYLQHSLPLEVLEHIIVFTKITDQQVEHWTENPCRFITEEELVEDAVSPVSVRDEARNIMLNIVHCSGGPAAGAFCDMILTQMKGSDGTLDASPNWWKLHEASIEVFRILKDDILKEQMAGKLSFDIRAFLEEVVLVDLENSEFHPLLISRCLYVAGLYAEQMPLELRSKFLERTINCLKNRPACVRICAAKAAASWLRTASAEGNNNENDNLLVAQLPTLFQELFNLGNQLMSPEVLTIVLENFAALTSIDKAFTASVESSICTLTIAAFTNFGTRLLRQYCREIFGNLMQNPECIQSLQTRLVPTLVAKLAGNPSGKSEKGIEDDILEVLKLLLQHAPQPLSNILIEIAFPASCRFILSTFEYYIMLRGSCLIRQFLSVAAEQVLDYNDGDGKTGFQYILSVATHLFSFETSPLYHPQYRSPGETVDHVVSDVAMTLIKFRGLQENFDPLLGAVLSRLHHVEPRIMRRLLLIYVHMMNIRFDAVLDFLSAAPESGERSALSFVISDGFCKQFEKFEGQERKLVTLILSKILEYALGHRDCQLHEITFEEAKEDAATTEIPILMKIGSIITNEIWRDVKDCKEQ